MNKKFTQKFLVRQGVIAALYAVFTLAFPNLSYGPLQFRASEVMTLLAFFNPEYIWGLTLGCFIANLFSPYIWDMIIGTLASFLAVYYMSKCKNIWIASLIPAVANILVGLEIFLVTKGEAAFFITTAQIMISEIIIVTIIGVPLFKLLKKNKQFVNILELDRSKLS
ncbi:MAG: QueT transporter family protein [Lagierella massiliensis]|nr:QueT transporter family protein [Lagierella massiliensis]